MTSFPVVARLLAKSLDIPAESILADTKLEDLGADSLSVIELIFDLEDEFGIKLGDERPVLVTVQDIADYIDRYVSQAAADT